MEDEQKQSGEASENIPGNPMLRDPMRPQSPPPHAPSKSKTRRGKVIGFVVAGLVVLVLVAAGLYWFVLREEDKQPASQQTNTGNNEQQEETEQPAVPDDTLVTFKSEKLNIELTHRKDWTLKESSDGAITITSPRITYRTSDNTSKTSVFTLRIRKGASEAQKAAVDKSIATRDSKIIAYAAPVEGQRKYTNLSFVGPKDMFGFFIVTGNFEFKAGEPLLYALPIDGNFYLIAGGYGADSTNSLAFDPVPKDAIDSITLEQAIDIVESLKIY
jgi:lipopolysaccharide export system protein LptC